MPSYWDSPQFLIVCYVPFANRSVNPTSVNYACVPLGLWLEGINICYTWSNVTTVSKVIPSFCCMLMLTLCVNYQLNWNKINYTRLYFSSCRSAQSCPALFNPMDCSPPGSSVHGIFQARILEWGAIAFSACIGRILYHCAAWETHFSSYHDFTFFVLH